MNSEDTDWKYGNEIRERQRKVDRGKDKATDGETVMYIGKERS